jgi:hypothetical protein
VPKTVKLTNPIKAYGEEVTELTLADCKVKHLKATDKEQGDLGKIAALIVALANIPPSSVDEISVADFKMLSEEVAGFLLNSQETGETNTDT